MSLKLIAAVLVSVWSTSAPPERASDPIIDKVQSQSTTQVAAPRPAEARTPILTRKRARIANGPSRAPRERGCT